MPDRTMLYSSLKGNSGIFLQRFCIQIYRTVNNRILLPLHKCIKIMIAVIFERGCVTMTHGLLWETQMTCQSSQTGSVCVQTDLAPSIHYSERLAKPGSAHPLLITAGRHIRLTPSSVDTHALVHTPESHAFHCAHTHGTVAVIFVQPPFARFLYQCMQKITKKTVWN